MARDTLVRNTTAGPVVGFSDTQPIRSHSPALDGTEADGGREPVLKWLVSSPSSNPELVADGSCTGCSLRQSWPIRATE